MTAFCLCAGKASNMPDALNAARRCCQLRTSQLAGPADVQIYRSARAEARHWLYRTGCSTTTAATSISIITARARIAAEKIMNEFMVPLS